MDTHRRTAVTAGTLFIVATAASLLGTAIEQPALQGADYLTGIMGNPRLVSAGGLFELIAAGTSAGIAISLYPVLRNWGPALALGSVVFRAIEAAMYSAGAVSLLSLLTVGRAFTNAPISHRASLQVIGDSLMGARQEFVLAGVFAFSLGALMYYSVFYRSRLIPRWLSAWGVAAVMLMLVACVSALFSGNPVTSYVIFILPIAIQEMVLAVWLIAKGFSSSAHLAVAAYATNGLGAQMTKEFSN